MTQDAKDISTGRKLYALLLEIEWILIFHNHSIFTYHRKCLKKCNEINVNVWKMP